MVCATYGLPVTGTSTAITSRLDAPDDPLLPHPAASSARPARNRASRRTAESLQTGGSEIGLLDDPARGDLGDRALGDDGARAEHEPAVGHAAHEAQVVLDHQHRDTALADPVDRLDEHVELLGARAGSELVHEQHLRL